MREKEGERDSPLPLAGQRAARSKGAALVREVKNRPSPGHTRIAFIYLLYARERERHESVVIPFGRKRERERERV